jgi:hypothetical protein
MGADDTESLRSHTVGKYDPIKPRPRRSKGAPQAAPGAIERHRTELRRRLKEEQEGRVQATDLQRWNDLQELQQQHESRMFVLQRDLQEATDRLETTVHENAGFRARTATLEAQVVALRLKVVEYEERLACYQLGGDMLGRFMAHFQLTTVDEAVQSVVALHRTMAIRDRQCAAYEAKHAILEQQLSRLTAASEDRTKATAARVAEAEAARAKAEQQLAELQKSYEEAQTRLRTLRRTEDDHGTLCGLIGRWHSSWMQRAKYWGYVSYVTDASPMRMLGELNELADQFLTTRVSSLYQELCKLASSVCEEFFPDDPALPFAPLKAFQQLREAARQFKTERHQDLQALPHLSVGGDASPSSPRALPPSAAIAAVRMLQRRRQRVPSPLDIEEMAALRMLMQHSM